MLPTPALGRLLRGRVRPLISLPQPARHQVPRLVCAVCARLVSGQRVVRSCTAAKYSNDANQHRPNTPARSPRRTETTSSDFRAENSHGTGRHGDHQRHRLDQPCSSRVATTDHGSHPMQPPPLRQRRRTISLTRLHTACPGFGSEGPWVQIPPPRPGTKAGDGLIGPSGPRSGRNHPQPTQVEEANPL